MTARRAAPVSAGTPATAPVETELKLRIAPEAAAKLPRHPSLAAVKRGRARRARVVSTYYDTEDCALAAAGIALRLRRDGRRWVQTVKGPADATGGGGVAARTEFEWPVAGGRLDPLRFATTPFRRALGRAEQQGLVAQFTTDFTRTTIPLAFADSTMALLCIDVGEVRTADAGPVVRAPIHEIEIELEAGDVAQLFDLAHALAADVPLAFEPASKAERGFALRHPPVAAPIRASDADLPAKCTAGEAFAAFIRACLRQIEGNAHGVVVHDDPEWIHQMRIGVRRLRACLSLARKGMAPDAHRAAARGTALARAGAGTGARPRRVHGRHAARVHRRGAARRHRGAARESRSRNSRRAPPRGARRRARSRARRSPRPASSGSCCSRPRSRTRPAPMRQAMPATRRTSRDRRATTRGRCCAGGTATWSRSGTDLAHATPEARHAARLAAKKLRYATEFFASLYPTKRTRNYRRALTALQDELGLWNDTHNAARLAAELAGPQSPAAAAFSGWAAARGAERGDALAAAWGGFAKARPFWAPR